MEKSNGHNSLGSNNGRSNNKSATYGNDSKITPNYGIAPYNFVSLPERSIWAYEDIENIPGHNSYRYKGEELLNGTIEYDVEAKTPIIISKGNNKNNEQNEAHFFKNLKGQYTIPASTMRGLVRNNAAILSMSNISDQIEDRVFSYRSFDKSSLRYDYAKRLGIIPKQNDEGKHYSLLTNVFAGYIYKKDENEYDIIPAKKVNGESYFRISEMKLRKLNPNIKEINYMYKKEFINYEQWKKKFVKSEGFCIINKKSKDNARLEQNLKNKFIFDEHLENKEYKPYRIKISFQLSNKRDVSCIGIPEEFNHKGYLLCSNSIRGKEAHYIINEYDEEKEGQDEIELKDRKFKIIENYEDDLLRTNKAVNKDADNEINEKKYNELKEKYEYYYLPEEIGKDKGKPIFYAEFEGYVYIGFTPYFRIYYDYSIKDGIPELYKDNDEISYCDAVFGFCKDKKVNDKKKENSKSSFKSRVSFEDAIINKEITDKNSPKYKNFQYKDRYNFILGEPKASCFPNYIKQEEKCNCKDLKNYNNKDFEIRGVKNYWLKEYINNDDIDSKNKNVQINIFPLKAGSTFKGKIAFNNLKKEELGLLLWALRLENGCNENIGLAKPYGFGQIEINNIELKVENLQKKYKEICFKEEFTEGKEIEKFITEYKDYFEKKHKVNIENTTSVREFMNMKSNTISKKFDEKFRYMNFKEYAQRNPLPSVNSMLGIIGKDVKRYVAVDEVKDDSKTMQDKTIKSKEKLHSIKCVVCGKIIYLNDAQVDCLNRIGLNPKCNNCKK